MRRAALAAAGLIALLLPSLAGACEAVTQGWGLPGRFAEAEFSNRNRDGGRFENWAPRRSRLILHAGFDDETEEYGHGILGPVRDTKELTIHVRLPGDDRITCPMGVILPRGEVFEDIAPRLADIDGDGLPEVIVVQSDVQLGARLAIYDRRARLVAATPPIGRTRRWLAPVGAADLDGDGFMEIAYVDRPHLARVLMVWRYRDGALEKVAEIGGLTNHRIGDGTILGGIRDCGGTPEMITASPDWSRLMATRFDSGRLVSRDIGANSGPGAVSEALACR